MLEKRIGVVKDVYSRFIVIDFGAYCESFNKVDFMVSKPEAMIDVVYRGWEYGIQIYWSGFHD